MTIDVTCACGRGFGMPDHFAGDIADCPSCGTTVTVPDTPTPKRGIKAEATQASVSTAGEEKKQEPGPETASETVKPTEQKKFPTSQFLLVVSGVLILASVALLALANRNRAAQDSERQMDAKTYQFKRERPSSLHSNTTH